MSAQSRLIDTYAHRQQGRWFEPSELPPFELPGVSKIEFAMGRRSFATHIHTPRTARGTLQPIWLLQGAFATSTRGRLLRGGHEVKLAFMHFARATDGRSQGRRRGTEEKKNVSPQLVAGSRGIFARPVHRNRIKPVSARWMC